MRLSGDPDAGGSSPCPPDPTCRCTNRHPQPVLAVSPGQRLRRSTGYLDIPCQGRYWPGSGTTFNMMRVSVDSYIKE